MICNTVQNIFYYKGRIKNANKSYNTNVCIVCIERYIYIWFKLGFFAKILGFSLSKNAFFFFFFYWVIVYCGGIESRVNGYKMNRVLLGYKA